MTRYPRPGELWKVGRQAYKWFELIILVKDVDNWIDDCGRHRFIAISHFDSMTINGMLEDTDWEWELIQSI